MLVILDLMYELIRVCQPRVGGHHTHLQSGSKWVNGRLQMELKDHLILDRSCSSGVQLLMPKVPGSNPWYLQFKDLGLLGVEKITCDHG